MITGLFANQKKNIIIIITKLPLFPPSSLPPHTHTNKKKAVAKDGEGGLASRTANFFGAAPKFG